MNKGELIEMVANESKSPKSQAERWVNSTLEGIQKGLKKDKKVQLVGFGTFSIKTRKARKGRNPKTGEEIQIKATKTVAFKVGKDWKTSL
ncbi:MAG: HU family DNA-binding protein [Planctomycetes bacterium]|nr:HU family DNA-binding protein [Planctomycetota bacterium]